jgi:hypothetical protein
MKPAHVHSEAEAETLKPAIAGWLRFLSTEGQE